MCELLTSSFCVNCSRELKENQDSCSNINTVSTRSSSNNNNNDNKNSNALYEALAQVFNLKLLENVHLDFLDGEVERGIRGDRNNNDNDSNNNNGSSSVCKSSCASNNHGDGVDIDCDDDVFKLELNPSLCQSCSMVFDELYQVFVEFVNLRKTGSYLSRKIRQVEDLFTVLFAQSDFASGQHSQNQNLEENHKQHPNPSSNLNPKCSNTIKQSPKNSAPALESIIPQPKSSSLFPIAKDVDITNLTSTNSECSTCNLTSRSSSTSSSSTQPQFVQQVDVCGGDAGSVSGSGTGACVVEIDMCSVLAAEQIQNDIQIQPQSPPTIIQMEMGMDMEMEMDLADSEIPSVHGILSDDEGSCIQLDLDMFGGSDSGISVVDDLSVSDDIFKEIYFETPASTPPVSGIHQSSNSNCVENCFDSSFSTCTSPSPSPLSSNSSSSLSSPLSSSSSSPLPSPSSSTQSSKIKLPKTSNSLYALNALNPFPEIITINPASCSSSSKSDEDSTFDLGVHFEEIQQIEIMENFGHFSFHQKGDDDQHCIDLESQIINHDHDQNNNDRKIITVKTETNEMEIATGPSSTSASSYLGKLQSFQAVQEDYPTDEELEEFKQASVHPPFFCPRLKCSSKKFQHITNYLRHVRTHLQMFRFKCPSTSTCPHPYKNFKSLKEHCEKYHDCTPTPPDSETLVGIEVETGTGTGQKIRSRTTSFPRKGPRPPFKHQLFPTKHKRNGGNGSAPTTTTIIATFTEAINTSTNSCTYTNASSSDSNSLSHNNSNSNSELSWASIFNTEPQVEIVDTQNQATATVLTIINYDFEFERSIHLKNGVLNTVLPLPQSEPFKCPCPCSTPASKAKSRNSQEEPGPGQDQTCKKSYKTSKELTTHIRATHGKFEYLYKCPQCAKLYPKKSQLFNNHLPICGTGKKHKYSKSKTFLPPFICQVCQQEFPKREKLLKHCRRFHSDKMFQCDQCSRGFKLKQDLNRHMVTHTSERGHICDDCGKSYKTLGNLKFHFKIAHTEEGRLQYNQYSRLKNQRIKLAKRMGKKE